MAAFETVRLTGRSGASYPFTVFPYGTPLAAVSGVYAVLRDERTTWSVLYIGQTGDLSERFDNHHHAADFAWHRASHLAAIGASTEEQRLAIEADLVQHHAPPINQTVHG